MAREEYRDLGVNDRAELARIRAEVGASSLYNEDLAPTGPEERTWTTYNIAALWIGMAMVIPGAQVRLVFRTGGIITALIGVVSFPWVLFDNVGAYIFT